MNPQAEREKMLGGGGGGGGLVYEGVGGEVSRLRRENICLRDQLQRSLKELSAYQIKYPSAYASVNYTEGDMNDFPPWTTSPEIMTPLFEAYDARVKELEAIVGQQAEQLVAFQQKVEAIVGENEELRETQLKGLRNTAAQGGAGFRDSIGLHPSGPMNAELLAEMSERVDILMAENALMVEQKVVLASELDGLQDELMKRTEEVGALSQQLAATARELQSKSVRAVQAEKDRDEAAKQAVALSDALGRMEGETELVREQLHEWQQKHSYALATIQEFKSQRKELVENAEESAAANMRRTKVAETRVKELQTQLMQRTHELDSAQEVARKIKREYTSTRQDAEGMLQVMSGLERQLSEYANKEEEVEKKAKISKDAVEEALTARDQALASADQNRREIERLLEERKRMNQSRQSDIETEVEKARHRSQEQLRSCEAEMQELSEATAKLRVDGEKAIREFRNAKDVLEKAQRLQEEERKVFESTMKDLRDALTAAIVGNEEEVGRRLDVQEANKELRGTIDKLRLDIESLQSQLSISERSKVTEMTSIKATHREAQKELLEKTRLLARKTKDMEEFKASAEAQIASIERRMAEESSLFRKRAAEAENIAKEFEASRAAEELRTNNLIDQLKERTSASISHLEASLRNESSSNERLASRIRELENSQTTFAEEKAMLITVIEEARVTISELQEELLSAKSTILELTDQLADSHAHREEASRRAASTIEGVYGYQKRSIISTARGHNVPYSETKKNDDENFEVDEDVEEEEFDEEEGDF